MHFSKGKLNPLNITSATKYKRLTNLKYFAFDSLYQKQLLSIAPNIDKLIDTDATLKSSKKTSAKLFSVDSDVFFGKHVRFYNKVFYSRLRYIIQPTRDLWAAWIAKKLENSGILTPKVYAIGQRKNLGIITDTYIITEALLDAQSLHDFVYMRPNDALSILERGGKAIRQLHNAGVTHGDAKLANLYLQNEKIGFWDLDSAKIFKGQVPKMLILEDLARFLSSFLRTVDESSTHKNIPVNISIGQVCNILAESYGIESKELLDEYYKKWHLKLNLNHFDDELNSAIPVYKTKRAYQLRSTRLIKAWTRQSSFLADLNNSIDYEGRK